MNGYRKPVGSDHRGVSHRRRPPEAGHSHAGVHEHEVAGAQVVDEAAVDLLGVPAGQHLDPPLRQDGSVPRRCGPRRSR